MFVDVFRTAQIRPWKGSKVDDAVHTGSRTAAVPEPGTSYVILIAMGSAFLLPENCVTLPVHNAAYSCDIALVVDQRWLSESTAWQRLQLAHDAILPDKGAIHVGGVIDRNPHHLGVVVDGARGTAGIARKCAEISGDSVLPENRADRL